MFEIQILAMRLKGEQQI